jgi:hypothetical protein
MNKNFKKYLIGGSILLGSLTAGIYLYLKWDKLQSIVIRGK